MNRIDLDIRFAGRVLRGARLAPALVLASFLGLAACGDSDGPIVNSDAEIGEGNYKFTVTDDDFVIGDANAPVTIVEYASMTCTHCAAFHASVYPTLKEKYIKTGLARLIFRPYPLDGVAAQASMLIRCVPKERRIGLVDAIFSRQRQWAFESGDPQEGLVRLATEATVSRQQFAGCVADQGNRDWLQATMEEAINDYDVSSTPTFFINGQKRGAFSAAMLDEFMVSLLTEDVIDAAVAKIAEATAVVTPEETAPVETAPETTVESTEATEVTEETQETVEEPNESTTQEAESGDAADVAPAAPEAEQ